ncbi:MAG: DUF4230 domain-containing protein [Caldilineaceae bacterium]
MKSVERPLTAFPLVRQPRQFILLVVMALALIILLLPFTLPPLLQHWYGAASANAVSSEPWPAAPPTYVPPSVAQTDNPSPVPTATPLPAPVWQELSYLTTVEFTTNTVVQEVRTADVPFLGTVVSDRLLLKAVGDVQVGVDLARVKDVQIEGKHIRFTIPKPEVTSVELLPQESQVFERVNVWLLSQYPGLETAALAQASQQMRADVGGNPSLMKLAQEFSRLQLTEFLQKAGFTAVEIEFW